MKKLHWMGAGVCAAVAVLLSGCVFGGPARNGAMFPDESGSLPFGERITGEEFVAESRELVLEYKQKLAELGAAGWENPEPEQYNMNRCENRKGITFISSKSDGSKAKSVSVEKVLAVGQEVFESRGYVRESIRVDETSGNGRVRNGFEWVDVDNGVVIAVGTVDGDDVHQVRLYVRTGCLPVDDFEALRPVANTELPTRTWREPTVTRPSE